MDYGLNNFQGKELGFTLLNYVSKFYFDLKFQSIFLISSIITVLFVNASLSRFDNRYIYVFGFYIFIFSGFYTQSFNIVRQSMAMAMALYSLKYVEDRKFFPFLITIIGSSFFHMSSLIFLPVYYIGYISLSRKKLFIGLIAGLFLGDIVLKVLTVSLESLGIRYASFLVPGEDDVTSGSGLMQLVILGLCLFAIYHKNKIKGMFLVYFNVFYLFCFFNLVFFDFMLGIRAIQVYKISMLVFVPYLFQLFVGKTKYLILGVCVIYMLGFYHYLVGSTNIIPYQLNLDLISIF